MIYQDDKKSTQEIKKLIKPHNPWKIAAGGPKQGKLTEQRPNPGSPEARILPIRGR